MDHSQNYAVVFDCVIDSITCNHFIHISVWKLIIISRSRVQVNAFSITFPINVRSVLISSLWTPKNPGTSEEYFMRLVL